MKLQIYYNITLYCVVFVSPFWKLMVFNSRKKLYISDLQKRRVRHIKIWDDYKSSTQFDDWKSSLLYFETKIGKKMPI